MRAAIIFGPPGAGKGTQCSLLNSRLGFNTISTGAIIRQEISLQSELGLRVQQIVESGKLVDDTVILSCLESALKSLHLQKDSVILLDGIPRNLAQAVGLDKLLASFGGRVNKVISLQSDLESLLERFSKRWTCSVCNKVESITQPKEISSYKCSSCGSIGSMLRRKDDDLQTAKHRFSVYQEETLPLISYYQDRGVFESVDALLTPEIVYIKAASILLQM